MGENLSKLWETGRKFVKGGENKRKWDKVYLKLGENEKKWEKIERKWEKSKVGRI